MPGCPFRMPHGDAQCASQRLPLLIGTLCLAACDDSSDIILIPLTRTGTFVLQTVNNQALPATVVDSVSPPLRIDVTVRCDHHHGNQRVH